MLLLLLVVVWLLISRVFWQHVNIHTPTHTLVQTQVCTFVRTLRTQLQDVEAGVWVSRKLRRVKTKQ